jgi:hypothetical protein
VIANTGRQDKVGVINDGLDFGLRQVCRTHPFDELRPEFDVGIVATDTRVQLPKMIKQIVELRLLVPGSPVLSYPMELMRKKGFVEVFPNVTGSTITGRPLYCYQDGDFLFLDRKSNGTYTIRMTALVNGVFESDTDETPIRDIDDILIAYATSHLYKSVQLYDDATYWQGQFAGLLRSEINAVQKQIGVHVVAKEWSTRQPIQTNQPWLDPFEGHKR